MITLVMCSARRDPGYKYIVESLLVNIDQLRAQFPDAQVEFLAIDENIWHREKEAREELAGLVKGRLDYRIEAPKPSVWRGPHRLTKRDHWDKQSALNTAACYAKHPRLAFFDDNAVLGDGWLLSHVCRGPQDTAIAGSYKYWHPGVMVDGAHVSGYPHVPGDHRLAAQEVPGPCHPGWLYGGNMSLPLEVVLKCNGWEELLSGYGGLEDTEFSVRASRVVGTYFMPHSVVHYLSENHDIIGDYVGHEVGQIKPEARAPLKAKLFPYKDHEGVIHQFTYNHVPIWYLSSHNRGKHLDGENYMAVYDPKLEGHKTRITTLGNVFNLRVLRKWVQSGKSWPKSLIDAHPGVDWRDGQNLCDMG